MAEKSPRPEEEDAEEEGEEAAEPPVRPVKDVKEEEEKEEAPPESPPESPPEEATSPPPLKPEPPFTSPVPEAFPHVMPVYPSGSSAFYTPDPAYCPSVSGVNLFANDGSFMEMFKKKMEATGSKEETGEPEEKKPEPDKRKPVSFVGKRRGGAKLALKTGIVAKKPKTDEEEIMSHKGGAWAQYMAEVKKYKAHQCSDDDKTRPLVK